VQISVELPKPSETAIVEAREKAASAFDFPRHFAALSFFFGSAALLSSSMPSFRSYALPLALIGMLVGVGSLFISSRRALAAVGLASNAAAVLGIVLFPRLFPFMPSNTQLDPDQLRGKVCRITTGYSRNIPVREEPIVLDTPEPIDMSKYAIQQDDIRVRILSASVGPIPFKVKGTRRETALLLTVRLYHVGSQKTIHYQSWNRAPIVVVDESGRRYPQYELPAGAEIEGQVASADLAPMGFVKDLLVFKPPPKPWTRLRLELPASSYGSSGTLHLEIPPEMLEKVSVRSTESR
jgi:hypothetical protein